MAGLKRVFALKVPAIYDQKGRPKGRLLLAKYRCVIQKL